MPEVTLVVSPEGAPAYRVGVERWPCFLGSDPTCDVVLDGLDPIRARLDESDSGIVLHAIGDPVVVDGREVDSISISSTSDIRLGPLRLRLVARGGQETVTSGPEATADRRPPLAGRNRKPLGRSQPAEPPRTPERIGPYRILDAIAQGGMGLLLRGRREDDPDAVDVAIKVLRPRSRVPEKVRQRFVREILLSTRLDHPNIVSLLDAGFEGEAPYMASELIVGRDLRDVVSADGPLEPDRVVDLFRQIAEGLAHAHEREILHRDLKPENVMVEEATGRALIIDFGLGRALDSTGTRLTLTGVSMGTPRYYPPEQILDAKRADRRSDVYGLGAILYHLLTSCHPFDGTSRMQVIRRILEQPPEPILSLRPDAPPAVAAAAERALAKDPSDRFDSVERMTAAVLDSG